jgi:signal transduction histidine kinase
MKIRRILLSYPFLAAIIFGLYFSTATLGLQLYPVSDFATLIWIPSGLSLAFLFRFGLRYWPAVALGALAANYFNDAPILAAAGISIGNTLEPVIGAYLLKRFVKAEPQFNQVNHVLGLIFLAALFSTLISATGGVTSLWLNGVIEISAYGSTWIAWWIGDAVSVLIVTPLILTWSVRPSVSINLRYVLELSAFSMLLALITLLVFVTPGLNYFENRPTGYFIFPLLVWVAMRFGQRASVTALFFLVVFASWQTAHGEGLFGGSDISNNLLNLQTYTIIMACTTMLLAATVSERKMFERRKDEFISVASHELKTPLTSIKAFTQTLQLLFERKGDKQSSAHMSRVNRQVDRLNRLVVKLLDMTRIQEGRITLQKEKFNIGSLIREIADEISEVTHHKIMISGDTRVNIIADKDRIGRVLTNLLANAVSYSPKADRIIVKVSKKPGYITICVQDFGIGIPKKEQENIFDRFYQGGSKASHKGFSVGLGLYIAKAIVERHGGKIWVNSSQSPKGKPGSRFYFTLPLKNTKA